MTWFEIKSHRILEVDFPDFDKFYWINDNGDRLEHAINMFSWTVPPEFTLAERKSDRRIFKKADFIPRNNSPTKRYLQEV